MALSSSWAPPTAIQRAHENTPEPMAPGDLQPPWVESPYSTHDRDMTTHMLPQELASPDTAFGHSYVTTAHPNPALLTPISLSDSAVLDPRHSPTSHIPHSQDPQYHGMVNHTGHGLGITMPPVNYGPPATIAHDDIRQRPVSILESPFVPISRSEPQPEAVPMPSQRQAGHRTGHVPIAPHPAGLQKQEEERRRRGQDNGRSQGKPRQQRRPRRQDPKDEAVTDYTIALKDRQYGWKDITKLVNDQFGVNLTTPCLQMRVHRRSLRLSRWSEDDVQRLRTAHKMWEENKFEIIAEKKWNAMSAVPTKNLVRGQRKNAGSDGKSSFNHISNSQPRHKASTNRRKPEEYTQTWTIRESKYIDPPLHRLRGRANASGCDE